MNILVAILFLSLLGSVFSFPASLLRQKRKVNEKVDVKASSSVRKHLSTGHVSDKNRYQSKTRKRHIRKKKQYILAGLGAGLGTGLAGYGYDYGSLGASTSPLGYATQNDAYGYAAGTQATTALGSNLLTNANVAHQRQNLLSAFAGSNGLGGQYSNVGLSNYGSVRPNSYSNAGMTSYSNGVTGSLNSAGLDPTGLSSSVAGSYDTKLSNDLSNSFGSSISNDLSNSQMNGIKALSSYGPGTDANSYVNLKGLNSLASYNTGGSDLGSLGEKYTAASLSAGLDTPNGISNIANLLNSASTSFDSDRPNQILASNNENLNSLFGQRFGNHLSGTHSTGGQSLGSQSSPYGSQQSTLAEAQAFGNQLNHLSSAKVNMGDHSHANYGEYGDDSNSLNEIGQIASTGISDSSLQRLLGQLMAGQMGHSDHMGATQGVGSLPSDTSVFEQGNTEQSDTSLDDQQEGFTSHQLSPLMHGQTVHAHASDKPKAEFHEGRVSTVAIQKAMNVQLKADKEHQKRLKNLKDKLRMLREKLHKLKSEYDEGSEDDLDSQLSSELSEKSEMETLDDLKKATEDAIKELQKETLKTAKAKSFKGSKKLIFIHKYPQSKSQSSVTGKKKGGDVGELGTELLELIEDENSGNGQSPTKYDGQAPRKEDATQSLTDLEKQAEQEVNFLTNKSPKVIRKHQHPKEHTQALDAFHPGLHIRIPEPVDEGEKSYSKIGKLMPFGSNASVQSQINRIPQGHSGIRAAGYNSSTRARHSLGFFSIGCWRDQPERALPSLEGIFPILDGSDYMHRTFAIRKCAQVARVQGFYGFAIEHGGHCLGGKNILQTYSMYGPSRACRQDGKGGPWSMEVYKFTTSSVNPKSRRGDIIRAIGLEDVRDVFFKGHKN